MEFQNNLTIGISTFKHRIHSVITLINQIRGINQTVPIIVAVNGEYDEPFDESYRKEILTFFANTPFVYPIFHTEFRSLAKLWNEIIIHSSTEFIYMLNDDVEITNPFLFDILRNEINKGTQFALMPAYSYSHFLISKSIANELNYFDERLLFVGCEDGAWQWAYENKFGKSVKHVPFIGVHNKGEYNHTPKMICHKDNKATFNEWLTYNFLFKKHENGIKAMYDYQVVRDADNPIQYPHESFYKRYKEKGKEDLKIHD